MTTGDPRRSAALAISRALVLVGLAALVAPSAAAAQTVVGVVTDPASGRPVAGALVLLLDSVGARVGGALTSDAGRFVVGAPSPGRHTLRAERIGYATAISDPFMLLVERAARLDLTMDQTPVELEGLDVEGERRCRVRPAEGLVVARLWDEARKALRNQAWGGESGRTRFHVVERERELDLERRLVITEEIRDLGWTTGNPIRSRPPEELIEEGFVRRAGDGGWTYHGPDADVLLSDLFLDTHCLRLADPGRDPALIGVSFEPVRRRGVADIEGTLWLEREGAVLRTLEYAYTWSPWAAARGVASGRVEFEPLPGGLWIVRRWRIHMPKMVQDATWLARGMSGLRVAAIAEAGGEVVHIGSSDDPASHAPPPATSGDIAVEARAAPPGASTVAALCPGGALGTGEAVVVGTVRDSRTGAPIGGAGVDLEWTDYRVVADRELVGDVRTLHAVGDASGRYRACGIPPGVLLVARASAGGAKGRVREVEIPRDGVVVLDLSLESRQTSRPPLLPPSRLRSGRPE